LTASDRPTIYRRIMIGQYVYRNHDLLKRLNCYNDDAGARFGLRGLPI
jgi:hypothetical protein